MLPNREAGYLICLELTLTFSVGHALRPGFWVMERPRWPRRTHHSVEAPICIHGTRHTPVQPRLRGQRRSSVQHMCTMLARGGRNGASALERVNEQICFSVGCGYATCRASSAGKDNAARDSKARAFVRFQFRNQPSESGSGTGARGHARRDSCGR